MPTIEDKTIKPAVVTVGNELTFGERRNGNQEWLCQQLFVRGIPAQAVMSLPDDVDVISHWIRQLKQTNHYPILVSGGIGGTHDDLTREAVAVGLGVALCRHQDCYAILSERYGERFTPQRQRMADLPEGCGLITNPIGAPGFHLHGVFGFPGFPTMLQPMFETVAQVHLSAIAKVDWQITEFALAVAEGDIALDIETFDQLHSGVHIGIYPSTEKFRREVTVRLRYPPARRDVDVAFRELLNRLAQQHGTELIAPRSG